jgi:hypothetical protein
MTVVNVEAVIIVVGIGMMKTVVKVVTIKLDIHKSLKKL